MKKTGRNGKTTGSFFKPYNIQNNMDFHKVGLFVLLLFLYNTTRCQTTYVFVGTFNPKPKRGIYVLKLDTQKDILHKVSVVKGFMNPSYLTVSHDGNYLYACIESQKENAGSIASFHFNAKQGSLAFLNKQRSGGENPVYLTTSENGKWLLNVNYTQASLDVFPVVDNGGINSPVQIIHFTKGSHATERQDKAHTHSVTYSPDEKFIYLPDLGDDAILSYQIDTAIRQPVKEGTLTIKNSTPGSGPRHFVFHPNGMYAYCIEEISGSISCYHYDDGMLDSIQRIMAHEGDSSAHNSADIHISPDGKFLYASNRGDENNIAIYAIDKNGHLSLKGYQSTYGNHPRIFAIDSSGNYLIVANQISGDVVLFRRDSVTGFLSKRGKKIKIKNASCVQIKNYESK